MTGLSLGLSIRDVVPRSISANVQRLPARREAPCTPERAQRAEAATTLLEDAQACMQITATTSLPCCLFL